MKNEKLFDSKIKQLNLIYGACIVSAEGLYLYKTNFEDVTPTELSIILAKQVIKNSGFELLSRYIDFTVDQIAKVVKRNIMLCYANVENKIAFVSTDKSSKILTDVDIFVINKE